MAQLTARLDDWCVARVGAPLEAHVLIGTISGHDCLHDGNIASTSPIRFLSADLSFAITRSQGRRYVLGRPALLTLKGVRVLATTLTLWRLPDGTRLDLSVDAGEISGRHLGELDG